MGDAVEAKLALARRAYELWNQGGVEALVEHVWAPDVVLHGVPEGPDTGVFRGAEAVAAHVREVMGAVDQAQLTVRSLEGRGDYVLATLDLSVEGTLSGARLSRPFFHLLRYEGGRMREFRQYLDADQARSEFERLAGPPT